MLGTIEAFACSDWGKQRKISLVVSHGPGTEHYIQETQRQKISDRDI